MSNNYILGCGGHTRSLIPLLLSLDVEILGIIDDNVQAKESVLGIDLIGDESKIGKEFTLIISTGNPDKRKFWYKKYKDIIDLKRYVAPSSEVQRNVDLQDGVHVFSQAMINSYAQIGKHSLVNTRALVEHECLIGEFTHIAVGAIVCGRVKIGNNCFIGAGAIIKDGVSIVDNVTVGVGAVVTKDITHPGTYVGVPAKAIIDG